MMNQMQMMDLENNIDKLWSEGNYREAVQIANDEIGEDNLDDTLGDRNIDDADALLGSLGGELQNRAESIQGPTARTANVQIIIDKINEVHGQGYYLYDMDGGLTGARPISLADFWDAVDSTNELMNGIQDEE